VTVAGEAGSKPPEAALVPLTRHEWINLGNQGCSQKALAPLSTVFAPLSRHSQPRIPANARRRAYGLEAGGFGP
jgi:hypothetical protein